MTNFKRTKFSFFYMMGLGFINIFDGLVIILTFGQITSQYQLQYVMWWHKKQAMKKN